MEAVNKVIVKATSDQIQTVDDEDEACFEAKMTSCKQIQADPSLATGLERARPWSAYDPNMFVSQTVVVSGAPLTNGGVDSVVNQSNVNRNDQSNEATTIPVINGDGENVSSQSTGPLGDAMIQTKQLTPRSKRKKAHKHVCTYLGCNKTYTTRWNLKIHLRSHTGEKPFHCGNCSKQFTSGVSLKRHLTMHTEQRQLQCELCSVAFCRLDEFMVHTKFAHPLESLKIKQSKQSVQRAPSTGDADVVFRVEEVEFEDVIRQTTTPQGSESVECVTDPSNASNTNQAFEAVPLSTGGDVENVANQSGTQPGKATSQPTTQRTEQARSKNPHQYVCRCTGCGKAYVGSSRLTAHLRNHTGEKPCRIEESKRHSSMHTKQCRFRCALCSVAFCPQDHFKAHVKHLQHREKLSVEQDKQSGGQIKENCDKILLYYPTGSGLKQFQHLIANEPIKTVDTSSTTVANNHSQSDQSCQSGESTEDVQPDCCSNNSLNGIETVEPEMDSVKSSSSSSFNLDHDEDEDIPEWIVFGDLNGSVTFHADTLANQSSNLTHFATLVQPYSQLLEIF